MLLKSRLDWQLSREIIVWNSCKLLLLFTCIHLPNDSHGHTQMYNYTHVDFIFNSFVSLCAWCMCLCIRIWIYMPTCKQHRKKETNGEWRNRKTNKTRHKCKPMSTFPHVLHAHAHTHAHPHRKASTEVTFPPALVRILPPPPPLSSPHHRPPPA